MLSKKITSLLKQNWLKVFSVTFLFLFFGAYANIFAIASPYNPGETLDPTCLPGEVNCTVLLPSGGSSPWQESGSDIYFDTGKVGIGTSSPTAGLTVYPGVSIIGPELITNGTFDTDASGWNIYDGVYNSGKVTVNYTGAEWWADVSTQIETEAGKTYLLRFSIPDIENELVYIYFDENNIPYSEGYGVGDNYLIFTADYTGTDVIWFESYFWNDDPSSSWSIDNVSLREISTSISSALEVYDLSGVKTLSLGGDQDLFAIGRNAGFGVTDSNGATFIGNSAGYNASGSYYSNFIGYNSGQNSTGADYSNILGMGAGQNSSNATYSNFLGVWAGQNTINSGSSNFLGPSAGAHASGSSRSNFIGQWTGYEATGAYESNFIGSNTGISAINAYRSNFIGSYAGYESSANRSNFMGERAGDRATNAHFSNFIGNYAGYQAISATTSNFIGASSGYQATSASVSNFIGNNAGYQATNASYSNFIGHYAGRSSTNAANSIFIGRNAGYQDTVDNTALFNDSSTFANTSILIGHNTKTGGFSNSIAIGAYSINTATNQMMVGSTQRPINNLVVKGATSTCTIDTAGGALSCTSDERLKTNITDLDDSVLERLLQIRTVNYSWLNGDSNKTNIGFLAQDLEQYFPELVSTDSEGYKSVYYANMAPILVEAIREMNLKLSNLSDLEEKNNWRDSIVSWFANTSNNIIEFVAGTLRARNKICIGEGEEEICITKDDLMRMKDGIRESSQNTNEPIIENNDNNEDGTTPAGIDDEDEEENGNTEVNDISSQGDENKDVPLDDDNQSDDGNSEGVNTDEEEETTPGENTE